MVGLLDVDRPNVVAVASQIARRLKPRHHRMVLVVVAVLAVASDELQVAEPVEIAANNRQRLGVGGVIDRIGLRARTTA